MENITLGQVATILAFLVGLIGSIEYLAIRIKKWLKIALKEELKPIQEDIKRLQEDLVNLQNSIDDETLARCKYDIVALMSKIQTGYKATIEEKRLLREVKGLYNDRGGDSYVDDMFEDLKKKDLI